MLRLAVLLSVSTAMISVALAQDAQQPKPDTVEVHGKALPLSCAEWRRNQDRSWTSIGALLVGTETMNVTLRGPKETKVLEEKCGDTQEPTVTPVKSAEPDAAREARTSPHGSGQRNVKGSRGFAMAPVGRAANCLDKIRNVMLYVPDCGISSPGPKAGRGGPGAV